MSRRKIRANELVDTDVSFVSLVKRGANRIPFRITKEDGPMLDLYKIGRSLFHKADSRPQIVAAVLQKGADLTKVAALFQKAGLEPKKFVKSEKSGVVTVAKADAAAAEDTMVVKMSDSFGLVVSGLKKSFDENDFSGTIYGEPLAKGGYVPSPRLAYAMLGEAVSQAFLKSADAEAMTSLLKTATDDYGRFVSVLARGLPEAVLKMDAAVANEPETEAEATNEAKKKKPEGAEEDVAKSTNGTGDGVEEGKGTGTDPKATADDKKTIEKQGETGTSPQGFAASTDETDKAAAAGSADDEKLKQNGGTTGSTLPDGQGAPAEVAKDAAETDEQKTKRLADAASGAGASEAASRQDYADVHKAAQAEVMKALGALQKSITETLTGLQQDFKKSVSDLTTRLDGVATMARKTDAALNGTVFGETGGDTQGSVRKSDHSGTPPLLDTAYSRRSAA
jgi:hypothetical protein